jgi:hypothetical protein
MDKGWYLPSPTENPGLEDTNPEPFYYAPFLENCQQRAVLLGTAQVSGRLGSQLQATVLRAFFDLQT